jgi:predicted flap endonuclease-1-like 5' DNA nuclease
MTVIGIIVALIALLIGFLLGWLVEWRIDLGYWRSYFEEANEDDPATLMALPPAQALQLPPGSQEVLLQSLREQLAQRDADLSALRATMNQLNNNEIYWRGREADLMEEARRLREQVDELTEAKHETEAEWRHELARREQQWLESREAELAALRAESAQLKQQLAELPDRLEAGWRAELERRAQQWRESREAELAPLRAESAQLSQQLLETKERVDAEWRAELARREEQWQAGKQADLAFLQTEYQELKERLAAAERRFERYRASHPAELSAIRGIGPKIEADLRRAGINSYAELARRTPDDLRLILNPPNWRKLDFESWIAQAELLARNEEE